MDMYGPVDDPGRMRAHRDTERDAEREPRQARLEEGFDEPVHLDAPRLRGLGARVDRRLEGAAERVERDAMSRRGLAHRQLDATAGVDAEGVEYGERGRIAGDDVDDGGARVDGAGDNGRPVASSRLLELSGNPANPGASAGAAAPARKTYWSEHGIEASASAAAPASSVATPAFRIVRRGAS